MTFRVQRYKEVFIPTTHVGTTRGYYGLNINIKKVPVLTHQDFKSLLLKQTFQLILKVQ